METKELEMISDFFAKVKFTKKCYLELRVCHLGESPYLKKRLENKTGCSITLYKGNVHAIFAF